MNFLPQYVEKNHHRDRNQHRGIVRYIALCIAQSTVQCIEYRASVQCNIETQILMSTRSMLSIIPGYITVYDATYVHMCTCMCCDKVC